MSRSENTNNSSEELSGSLVSNGYHWQPPPTDSLQINVDGATGNQCAAATIICDHNGKFIQGESQKLHHYSLEDADAMTFLLGLKLMEDMPSILIILEGDSQSIVKLLNDPDVNPPWRIRSIIADCQNRIEAITQVSISFVSHDCNKAAQEMAAIASKEQISLKRNGTSLPLRISFILEMDLVS